MIPKIIHQFKWKTKDKKQFVVNVSKSNKTWLHKLWTLDKVKKSYENAPENFKKKFDYFVEKGMTLEAEEISKFWILYSEGGIYIDNEFQFLKGKSLKNIDFGDKDVVLFNAWVRGEQLRIQDNIMAASAKNRFFLHLLDYIGNDVYFPRSTWDDSKLEVYSSSYITTHFELYRRLLFAEPIIVAPITSIKNTIKVPNDFYILDSTVSCYVNPEMVLKHGRPSNFVLSSAFQS